ncbi:MAG TPA: ABC transporter transmembrane domain-containing protein, partial [Bacteroidia bacterium]
MARKVKETDDLPKAKINKTSLKKALRIFEYTGKHKWKLYLGLVFLLLTSFTALLFPTMLGALVNVIDPKNPTSVMQDGKMMGGAVQEFQQNYFSNINDIGLYLIIVLSLQSVFSYFRIYLFVNYTENTLASLRQAVYAHLISLPMSFFVQQRVGDLNSRMSADISQIQDTLT